MMLGDISTHFFLVWGDKWVFLLTVIGLDSIPFFLLPSRSIFALCLMRRVDQTIEGLPRHIRYHFLCCSKKIMVAIV
jgi:hypothetical protein